MYARQQAIGLSYRNPATCQRK